MFSESAAGSATYEVHYAPGDGGPAGGIIFYDKGSISDGWRYLEAAPNDQSTDIRWNLGSAMYINTDSAAGTGKPNPSAIIAAHGSVSYAAPLCKNLAISRFSDWFLPSKDELNLVYWNLKVAGRGSFRSAYYWSSSVSHYYCNYFYAIAQDFGNGGQPSNLKGSSCSVRAIRAF